MLEGLPWTPPDARTVRMFRRFRELANSRVVREHLGLTSTEWDDEPVVFQRWATEFYRIDNPQGDGDDG